MGLNKHAAEKGVWEKHKKTSCHFMLRSCESGHDNGLQEPAAEQRAAETTKQDSRVYMILVGSLTPPIRIQGDAQKLNDKSRREKRTYCMGGLFSHPFPSLHKLGTTVNMSNMSNIRFLDVSFACSLNF